MQPFSRLIWVLKIMKWICSKPIFEFKASTLHLKFRINKLFKLRKSLYFVNFFLIPELQSKNCLNLGNLYFENAVEGFLADMFEKWRLYGSSHEVASLLSFCQNKKYFQFRNNFDSCYILSSLITLIHQCIAKLSYYISCSWIPTFFCFSADLIIT